MQGTVGWRWAHTPAAAAAALHIPVIDGGGDIPVAEAPYFQGVVITAVEGDIAPWRHLFCGQNWACKPTRTQKRRQVPSAKHNYLFWDRPSMREDSGSGQEGRRTVSSWPLSHPLTAVTWTYCCVQFAGEETGSEGLRDQSGVPRQVYSGVRTGTHSGLAPAPSHHAISFPNLKNKKW